MVALPYLSIIQFSDADAGDFLHNQVSADVLGLASGEFTFACYCEPKGRVLALMLIGKSGENYFVIMSSSLVQAVVDRLKIYIMRSKVSIQVLDEFSVSGLSADAPPETSSFVPVIALPDDAHWFLVSANDSVDSTDTASQNSWRASELQRGITWLRPETSGQFLPQMLGFDQLGAVNFRKGCYPGQEIVARTHYLGKVKRHPRVLQLNVVVCPEAFSSIQILSAGQSYEATVVDSGHSEAKHTTLFVVTRMSPDLVAEQADIQDQLISLA